MPEQAIHVALTPRAPTAVQMLGRAAVVPSFVRMRGPRRPTPAIDVGAQVDAALAPRLVGLRPQARVAVAVGSRGIAGLAEIVRQVIATIRAVGGDPFIVPAMGSHGGATVQGQREVLDRLGIDEKSCGAAILATMDTYDLGEVEPGLHAHLDAYAAVADWILLVNRIKSHTSFTGEIESGLAKQLAIGLGKQRGAEQIHRLGPDHLERRILACTRRSLSTGIVLGGIALVEDDAHAVRQVEFVGPGGIGGEQERHLLTVAKDHEARLPVDDLDVLVVDALGKDKSGTGMDTNVIGRRMIHGQPEPERPRIANIVALRLSPGSAGNATGVGLADFVPARLVAELDVASTYKNSLTAGLQGVQRAQLPITLASDRDAIEVALLTAAVDVPEQARVLRIRDTLSLDEVMASTSLESELSGRGFTRVAASPSQALEEASSCLSFDEAGDISGW